MATVAKTKTCAETAASRRYRVLSSWIVVLLGSGVAVGGHTFLPRGLEALAIGGGVVVWAIGVGLQLAMAPQLRPALRTSAPKTG